MKVQFPHFFCQISALFPLERQCCVRFGWMGVVFAFFLSFSVSYAQNFKNIAPHEDLPTLLGIASPSFDEETELLDPTLPPELARLGHPMAAIAEYYKLSHSGTDAEAAHALLEAAKLAITAGNTRLGRKALEAFLLRFQTHPNASQAFYLLAPIVEAEKRLPVIRLATSLFPEDDWVLEAQYAYFWDQAYENGVFAENDVSDSRLETLKSKLNKLNRGLYTQKYQPIFAAFPALYPFILKEKGTGIWQILLILILLWNIWYHWRHLNLPFTVLLLLVLGFMSYTFQQYNLKNIQLHTQNLRHITMDTWTDLQPKEVK